MPDRYVDPQIGNDAWNGQAPTFVGGVTGPLRTLAYAVGITQSFETLHIAPGLYLEQVGMPGVRNGCVYTTDGGYAVLEWNGTGDVLYTSNPIPGGYVNCEVVGLTIRTTNTTPTQQTLVRWAGFDVRMTDCTVLGNAQSQTALMAGGFGNLSDGVTLTRCLVVCPGPGSPSFFGALNVLDADRVVIERCTVVANGGAGMARALGFGGVTNGLHRVTVNNSILDSNSESVIRIDDSWRASLNWTGDRNNFHTRGGGTMVGDAGPTTYPTLATWQAYVAPDDAASIDADPLFVDYGEGVFLLSAGSSSLTLASDGGPVGPLGLGVRVTFADDWGGAGVTVWSFPGGTAQKEGGTNKIERLADPGEALATISGLIPAGYRVRRLGWVIEETGTAGDTADVLDTTGYVANTPNPMTIGAVQYTGAPGPLVDRERGRVFVGTSGTTLDVRAVLRDTGRVRQ